MERRTKRRERERERERTKEKEWERRARLASLPPLFLLPAEKLEGGELNSQLGARPSSQNLPKGWLLLEHALLEEGGREGGGTLFLQVEFVGAEFIMRGKRVNPRCRG